MYLQAGRHRPMVVLFVGSRVAAHCGVKITNTITNTVPGKNAEVDWP